MMTELTKRARAAMNLVLLSSLMMLWGVFNIVPAEVENRIDLLKQKNRGSPVPSNEEQTSIGGVRAFGLNRSEWFA